MFSESELVGSQPIFLLQIEFASQIHRFSSQPCEIIGLLQTFQYEGGLDDFDLSESSNMLGVDVQANTLSTSVIFPLNLIQKWRQGFPMEGSPGELSMVLK